MSKFIYGWFIYNWKRLNCCMEYIICSLVEFGSNKKKLYWL